MYTIKGYQEFGHDIQNAWGHLLKKFTLEVVKVTDDEVTVQNQNCGLKLLLGVDQRIHYLFESPRTRKTNDYSILRIFFNIQGALNLIGGTSYPLTMDAWLAYYANDDYRGICLIDLPIIAQELQNHWAFLLNGDFSFEDDFAAWKKWYKNKRTILQTRQLSHPHYLKSLQNPHSILHPDATLTPEQFADLPEFRLRVSASLKVFKNLDQMLQVVSNSSIYLQKSRQNLEWIDQVMQNLMQALGLFYKKKIRAGAVYYQYWPEEPQPKVLEQALTSATGVAPGTIVFSRVHPYYYLRPKFQKKFTYYSYEEMTVLAGELDESPEAYHQEQASRQKTYEKCQQQERQLENKLEEAVHPMHRYTSTTAIDTLPALLLWDAPIESQYLQAAHNELRSTIQVFDFLFQDFSGMTKE